MSEELLHLMQRTRVKKYHKSNPKKLLEGMITEIKVKTGHYGYRSWELMVEYLAKWLVLNKKTGLASITIQGFKGLNLKKDAVYKHLESLDLFQHYYTAAKADPWDYIGEAYQEIGIPAKQGVVLTPRNIITMMTRITHTTRKVDGTAEWLCFDSYLRYKLWYLLTYHVLPNHVTMKNPVKTQLDPCVGTGRFLIVATVEMPKANLILFGIEINLSLYRACLVNMAMFSNHPYSIICADTLRLDPDFTGPASKIWDTGNQWSPPDISAFYWKPPPINSKEFSLKYFAEEVKPVEKQRAVVETIEVLSPFQSFMKTRQ